MRQQKLKTIYPDVGSLARDTATIVNNEPTFTMELATGTVSTSITNAMVGINSCIHFMPTTAEAARLISTFYVSTTGKGYFVVTHGTATIAAAYTFDVHG